MEVFNMLKSFFGLSSDWSTLTLSGMLYQIFQWIIVFMILKIIFTCFFKLVEYLFRFSS